MANGDMEYMSLSRRSSAKGVRPPWRSGNEHLLLQRTVGVIQPGVGVASPLPRPIYLEMGAVASHQWCHRPGRRGQACAGSADRTPQLPCFSTRIVRHSSLPANFGIKSGLLIVVPLYEYRTALAEQVDVYFAISLFKGG